MKLGTGLGFSAHQARSNFDPLSTPSIHFYSTADNVVLFESSTDVNIWTDLSSAGNNKTQATQSDAPGWTSSGPDGKAEILFNPATQGMAAELNLGLTGAVNQTYNFLVRQLNTNDGQFARWQSNRGNLQTQGSSWRWEERADSTLVSITGAVTMTDYRVIGLVYVSATVMRAYHNGALVEEFDPRDWEGIVPILGASGDHACRAMLINETALDDTAMQNVAGALLAL